ncbi:MAG: hotdog fold thioesterase [Fimbriimonadaceae bacterium]
MRSANAVPSGSAITVEKRLWKRRTTPAEINDFCRGTMHDAVGLAFTEVGNDYLAATLPVDARTKQPYGILHGGASAVLAESLGSVASNLLLDEGWEALGIELNANHVKAVREGLVTGRVTALHIGRTLHVWDIKIVDSTGALTCVARLTVLVRERKAPTT